MKFFKVTYKEAYSVKVMLIYAVNAVRAESIAQKRTGIEPTSCKELEVKENDVVFDYIDYYSVGPKDGRKA